MLLVNPQCLPMIGTRVTCFWLGGRPKLYQPLDDLLVDRLSVAS